jgi:hypothetical protein
MIKIDKSLLKYTDSENPESLIQRHLDWFVSHVSSKKCPEDWDGYKGKFLKDFLIDTLNLKKKPFKKAIYPYIVGDRGNIEKLRREKKNLNGIKSKLTKKLKSKLSEDEIKKIQEEETNRNKIANQLYEAFCYDDFSTPHSGKDIWDAYKFCKGLNVDVCPYCNRQYIFTVTKHQERQKEGNEKCFTRPEIDHYYPKKIYPYLSCNLYNFIPACPTCNRAKSEYDEGACKRNSLIYPYDEGFEDDVIFKVKFNDLCIDSENLFNGIYESSQNLEKKYDNLKICIESNSSMKSKVELSKNTFHLEEIYNMQKLELADFLDRYRCYRDPKRREILKIFRLNPAVKDVDDEQIEILLDVMSRELEKQILGMFNTSKEYPLKKMKEDIKKQLDGEIK